MLAHVQVMTQEEQQAMIAELQARAAAAQRPQAVPDAVASTPQTEPAPQPSRVPVMAGGEAAASTSTAIDPADPSTWVACGRNDPCPCGSGKKYKHCHGRL